MSVTNAWLAEHVAGWERCTDKWCGTEKGCVAKDVVCGKTGGLDPGTNCKIHGLYPNYTENEVAALGLLRDLARGLTVVDIRLAKSFLSVSYHIELRPSPAVRGETKKYGAQGQFLCEVVPELCRQILADYPHLDWTKED